MPDQDHVNSEILHQLELVRRDLSRVEVRVGELVSVEKYTTEHAVQERDLARLDTRIGDLERARATMINMIVSSFILPIIGGVILYMLTSGK